ncbi:polysaccharide biosynthesis/export family protein [Sphingomonas sp. PB4P5]|uniref:polysaccharide biosynthesis/export family protein n=1 Tax=Parasphingomonas puruogangriensis TaxID=3096155 RepID=UPI002FC896ED
MHVVSRRRPGRSVELVRRNLLSVSMLVLLSGCGGGVFFGADGPSTSQIKRTGRGPGNGALLVEMNDQTAQRASDAVRPASIADVFGQGQPFGTVIAPGDTLRVTIYEAPPAVLFGAAALDANSLSAGSSQRASELPPLQVSESGTIDIPFAGRLRATGRSPQEFARDIAARLIGKAHSPQVLVSLAENGAAAVTVVGEVSRSARLPLTPRGERLLDAIAAGGGTREGVDKVSVQITRGTMVAVMPLEAVIRDPRQNVYLRPGDIVTAYYQSQSFTVLGAAGKNEEVKFEAQGITLAQALGRIGGVRDDRANPHGVFIFRLEDPAAIEPARLASAPRAPDGKIPVIYRVDLRDPVTFFAAQHFVMRDHDVVFVTSAPSADLQKFVNIIGAAIYPLVTVQAAGF